MSRLQSLWRNLRRRDLVERELDEELRAYVDGATSEHVRRGLDPSEARRRALQEFGSVEAVKQDVRVARAGHRLEAAAWDVRHAWRMTRHNSVIAAVTTLLIAGAVAFCGITFAVLDAVVLRKLPVPDPDQLVLISELRPESPVGRGALPFGVIEELRRQTDPAFQLFGFRGLLLYGQVDGRNEQLRILGVTGDYFAALRVRPALGNLFGAGEQGPVGVVSHDFWRRHFVGRPDVVGSVLSLGSAKVTIVGVAPREFVGTQPDAPWDVIMPFPAFQQARNATAAQTYLSTLETAVRLPPGVSMQPYAERLNAMWPELVRVAAPVDTADTWLRQRAGQLRVDSLNHGLSYDKLLQPAISSSIGVTFGLALIMSVAMGVSIALFAVARGIRHEQRAWTMLALGASRSRIVRPYVFEGAILAAMGLAMGLAATMLALPRIAWFVPGTWTIALTPTLAILAAVVALLGGLVLAVATSLTILRRRGSSTLQVRSITTHPALRVRRTLVACQVALSVVLLQYTLLYVRGFNALAEVPIGFETSDLQVHMLAGTLPSRALDRAYYERLQNEVMSISGVDGAGLSGGAPPLGYLADLSRSVSMDGRQAKASVRCIFPGFLQTLGAGLAEGRDLQWTDRNGVVLTRNAARALRGDESPLGHTIRTDDNGVFTVVGVINDVAYNGPRLSAVPMVLTPCLAPADSYPSSYAVTLLIRSARPLEDLRVPVKDAVERLGAEYVLSAQPQTEYLRRATRSERLLASVASSAGSTVLAVTALAFYAFCAYLLILRSRELAIRSALGATTGQTIRTLTSELWLTVAIGLVLGVTGSVAARTVLGHVIPGAPASAVSEVTMASCVVAIICACSMLVPVRRAARLDLAAALRDG